MSWAFFLFKTITWCQDVNIYKKDSLNWYKWRQGQPLKSASLFRHCRPRGQMFFSPLHCFSFSNLFFLCVCVFLFCASLFFFSCSENNAERNYHLEFPGQPRNHEIRWKNLFLTLFCLLSWCKTLQKMVLLQRLWMQTETTSLYQTSSTKHWERTIMHADGQFGKIIWHQRWVRRTNVLFLAVYSYDHRFSRDNKMWGSW